MYYRYRYELRFGIADEGTVFVVDFAVTVSVFEDIVANPSAVLSNGITFGIATCFTLP